MARNTLLATREDRSIDGALHEEIKQRAFELYGPRVPVDALHLETSLRAELPRALYAAAELQKYPTAEANDIRSVRAARVYLRALSTCIRERRELSQRPY